MGMISATPLRVGELGTQLEELDELRASLGREVGRSGPWIAALRRQVRASSVEGSTSIEGYKVKPGEAVALVNSDQQADPDDQARQAIACYARAMDHVGVMAADPSFGWLDRV